jgi:hypothetical protein
MAHEEEGNPGAFLSYDPVDNVDVCGYPVKAFPVSAMSGKAAFAGIVGSVPGGSAVTALIRRPDLYSRLTEPLGKPLIAEGMFRHAMNNVQYRPGLPSGASLGLPLPHKEPDAVIHG